MAEFSIHEAAKAEHADVAAFYTECGYMSGFGASDTVLVAELKGSIVGVARLCPDQGVVVLRGMQVHPDFKRQGIGQSLLNNCMARVGTSQCYCIPWRHLERFYASAGFEHCDTSAVPEFLSARYSRYLKDELDVILMRYPSKFRGNS